MCVKRLVGYKKSRSKVKAAEILFKSKRRQFRPALFKPTDAGYTYFIL